MKLGIAGAGKIAEEFLSFKDEVNDLDVQAIYARSNREGKLDKICSEYHIAEKYTDYDEMLQSNQIDVVYVAVVNDVHYEFCKKALSAGKHVICEKPFTANLKQFDDLCRIAEEKHLILLEAITVIYMPFYRKIRELVASLGKIKIVGCNYSQYSSRYEAFKRGEILPVFDVKRAGGALMDLNIYNIHFVTDLFGIPQEVHYYANIEKAIDVSGILVLEYPDFQCVCIGAKDCAAPVTSNIQGDRGCIHFEQPINDCRAFQQIINKQAVENYEFDETRHRMYYEFVKMTEIIDKKNYEEAAELLGHSRVALTVLNAARKSAGIVFPDDEAE
jgi:predicted dehydrogenase